MNKLVYIIVMIIALGFCSCKNEGGKEATKSVASNDAPASTVVSDSDSVNAAAPVAVKEEATPVAPVAPSNTKAPTVLSVPGKSANNAPQAPAVNEKQKPVETPKVPARPETETDKLVKQFNEALVALISSSKSGKADEAATNKFMELQAQLDELENNGELNEPQKELVKVVKDTYGKLNAK